MILILNQSAEGNLWFWFKSIFKRFWFLININNRRSAVWAVICWQIVTMLRSSFPSAWRDCCCIELELWIAVACLLIKSTVLNHASTKASTTRVTSDFILWWWWVRGSMKMEPTC